MTGIWPVWIPHSSQSTSKKRGFTALAGCAGPDCQAEVRLVLYEGVQEQYVRKSLRVFLSKAAIKINVGVLLNFTCQSKPNMEAF